MLKNKLSDYPSQVRIDGREYDINTDFSVWIEIEQLLLYEQGNYAERLAKVLLLAYPKLPQNPNGAMNEIVKFYSAGEESSDKSQKSPVPAAPVYNLKTDFEYIRAGFLSEFGIDLLYEDMHWWRFRRLLLCLGEDCRFAKIVAYRAADTSKIKNRETKRFFEKMKNRYRLPDTRTDEEKEIETAMKLEMLF